MLKIAMVLEAGATGTVPQSFSAEMMQHAAALARWHADAHGVWVREQATPEDRNRSRVARWFEKHPGAHKPREVQQSTGLHAGEVAAAVKELRAEGSLTQSAGAYQWAGGAM